MGFSGELKSASGHYEEFICAICVQLVDLEESVLTSCSHVYCRSCMEEWLRRKRSCPTCNKDLSLQSTSQLPLLRYGSPLAWRVLSRIRISCPLNACSWEGDYSELQAHLQSSSEHVQDAEQSKRETALALKEQANAKYSARAFRDALQLYTKAISFCDDISALYSNRAAVYLALGQYAAARDDAQRAVALDAGFAKAWVRCAKALVGLGDLDEAAAILRRVPAQVAAEPGVRHAQREMDRLRDLYRTAKAALAAGDFNKARGAASPLLSESSAPNVLLLAARSECEAGSCQRALKLALQVLRADSSEPAAYVVRSLAMLYNGEVDESIKYVREALRLSPDDKEALQLFRKIKSVRGHFADAKVALDAKQHDAAVASLNHIVESEMVPRRSTLYVQALAERANALFRAGRLDDALKDCASAIYLQEDNKRAWLTKVYALHALGRHETALRELEPVMQGWGQQDAVIRGAYEKAQFEVRKAKRPNYYEALSPKEGARPLSTVSSEPEIKAAYKLRALECHPDRLGPDASSEERKRCEEEFKLAGEALEILTDSFKRKLYDEGFDKAAIEERVQRASEQHHGRSHHHHR
ncbi:DnaJ-like subfamily C member 7 [Hondaea fermentalgiana]|uniref:DnaJ-like subfamily C member 7 n=1 Tax=Hondaea fermentalgiana TaxID=2315210 RepID=A0A2R5GJE3_9STRA|nr:DnaJ-like subfamily C member 7 [Hondaea fermentalgiana]|eukprot:GBG28411.1 DnaJ-like subfamily C member 7 [Hondaea fermentalgiana]